MPVISAAAGPTATIAGIRAPTRSRKSWAIPDRALLGALRIAGGREDAVGDVADEGDRGTGPDGRQMDRQGVGEALLVGDEQLLGTRRGLRCGSLTSAAPITITRWPTRPSRASASRAPTPPSSAVPTSSVESRRCTSAPARMRSRCSATSFAASRSPAARSRRERTVHRGPYRSQHLVPGAHADGDALRGDALGAQDHGIDDDRPVVAVEVAEDARAR